jgi:hypothetical protein
VPGACSLKQYFNVVSSESIDAAIRDYNSRNSYDTGTMNKTDPGGSLHLFTPIIEQLLDRSLVYRSGNFYKHTAPYLPHTDYKTYQDNTINVVIPLLYTGSQASLVVFDQEWRQDSVTWCMHQPVQYFSTNTGVKGYPYEYPITNKTGKSIDEDLYNDYLSHYPKDGLSQLSGVAYPFEPGSMMIFNNKRIHCTSKMRGEKLGISLRFKE